MTDTPTLTAPPIAVAIASIFIVPLIALALLAVWPIAPLLFYCGARNKRKAAQASH